MKIRFLTLVFFCLCAAAHAQTAVVSPSDLKVLEGEEWTGDLTYLDYTSSKKTTIKSNLRVTRTGEDGRSWEFAYLYPDEPKANGKSAVRLSSDGGTFNDQKIVEKARLADGTLKIAATKDGTDNDRKAVFRYTYLLGPARFSIKKEVRLEGTETFFERNTYTWTR